MIGDRRVGLADAGVLEVLHEQPRADQFRRGHRLGHAVAGLAAASAAGEGQDHHPVAGRPVRGQGAADAELDVVGVRADGQHRLVPGGGPAGDAQLDQPAHGRHDVVTADRLDHELVGVAAQRLHRVVHGGVGGHDRHGQLGLQLAQPAEELQPVHARHLDVGDHGVELLAGRQCEGLQRVEAGHRVHPGLAQDGAHELRDVGVVIDDQDADGAVHGQLLSGWAPPAWGRRTRRAPQSVTAPAGKLLSRPRPVLTRRGDRGAPARPRSAQAARHPGRSLTQVTPARRSWAPRERIGGGGT